MATRLRDYKGRFTVHPLVEDLTFLAQHGVGATEAAARTGFNSVKSLDKWLRRHGQVQLLNRLLNQDWDALREKGPRRHMALGRAS